MQCPTNRPEKISPYQVVLELSACKSEGLSVFIIFIIVGMNIIDLLAILPFYIELIQPTNIDNSTSLALDEIESNALFIPPSTSVSSAATPPPEEEVERVGGMDDVLQVFRIFKLARILKLAR